jgi:O-antigen/teichoic acid export membrane protein
MSRNENQSLLKGAGRYSIGSALGMVGSIARVGLTARLLPATDAGIWLGLQVLLGYGANLHMGVLFGMFRNVPLLRSRGDADAALSAVRTSWTFVLGASLLGGLGTVPLALSFAQASPRLAVETAVVLAVSLVRAFYSTLYKGDNRFPELGAASALGGAVSVISLPLIWLLKVEGVLLGMLVQYSLESAYMAAKSSRPRFGIEWSVLKELLRIGVMTMLATVGTVVLTSVDRTVMLRRFGAQSTGLYYLGANVLVLVPLLVALPFAVLTPKYFERVGRGEDLMPLVDAPMYVLARGLAPLLALGAVFVDAAVPTFFPNLVGGEDATLVAIAITYPLVLASFSPNVFYALDRQLPNVVIMGVCAAIGVAASFGASAAGGGIAAVAAGAGLGSLFYHVLSTIGATVLIGRGARLGTVVALRSLLPGAAMIIVVLALRAGVRSLSVSPWLGASMAAVVALALGAPWLRRSVRELRELRG